MQKSVISSFLFFNLLFLTGWQTADCQNRKDSLCFDLRTAAYYGSTFHAEKLLNDADIDIDCLEYGETTALGYAIQEGHLKMVSLLLSYGANPNGVPEMDILPLSLAVLHDQLQIAEELIVYGASLDTADYYGLTPLIRAIIQDNYLILDMLLHYGANPDIGLQDGTTPLQITALYRDALLADMLISAGAETDKADYRGFTPLMISSYINDTTLGNLLLEAGASTALKSDQGWTPLALAIFGSSEELIRLLAPLQPDSLRPVMMKLAIAQLNSASKKTLLAAGYAPLRSLLFTGYNINYSYASSVGQSFSSYSFGVCEMTYNMRLSAGFSHRNRPIPIAFRPPDQDSVSYQMMGRRYTAFFGIDKRIGLLTMPYSRVDLSAGLQPGYTWGSFNGSEKRPWSGIALGIKTGAVLEKKYFAIGLFYIYRKYNEKPSNPNHFSVETSLRFPCRKFRNTPKELPYELSF